MLEKRTPRQRQKTRDPKQRSKDFDEVALGFTEEQATLEAKRCIMCKKKPCVAGCPVDIDIPEFIASIVKGDYEGAIRKIKEKNNLPAICGRVCPQETQCEALCTLSAKGKPVGIGALERFAADWEIAHLKLKIPKIENRRGIKVAAVGSGPAGLTAAADLARLGYEVTLFESLSASGGVLRYGIPEFRLPKKILDIETEYVRSLGVDIKLNVLIGRTFTINDLFNDGYKAIFL
ncbi:MAG: dihydropyrimidine dehydrogenase, partial [Omnitrophica WOR_2 bacterium SM23_29]